jgi:hypothetical protein
MRQTFQTFIPTICLFLSVVLGCRRNENKLPVANAGKDQLILLPVNFVTLDGNASSDADGKIKTFFWKNVKGPGSFTIIDASAVKTEVKDLAEGVYEFELEVIDDDGGHSKDIVSVTVNTQVNRPPVANAGPDNLINVPAHSLVLDGRSSFDPDSNSISFSWTKISGPFSSNILSPGSANTWVYQLQGGEYDFELTVSDTAGLTDKDTVHITVNRPPQANVGTDQVIYMPASSVMLDASGSFDPDNNITGFQWTRMYGPSSFTIVNATSPQTQVNNLVEGEYIFQVAVKDAGNLVTKAYVHISVDTTMPVNILSFNNISWENDCSLVVNNFYSSVPQGQNFKVYVRRVNSDGSLSPWEYARPLTLSSSYEIYNYQIINGNLIVYSQIIDCGFDDALSYTIGIVM